MNRAVAQMDDVLSAERRARRAGRGRGVVDGGSGEAGLRAAVTVFSLEPKHAVTNVASSRASRCAARDIVRALPLLNRTPYTRA